jgi:hypothetical protein
MPDDDDFDVLDTLTYMVENPDEFSKDEMFVMLCEAADALAELRRQLESQSLGRTDGRLRH